MYIRSKRCQVVETAHSGTRGFRVIAFLRGLALKYGCLSSSFSAPGNLLETAHIDALNNINRQRTDGAGRTIQAVDAESNITNMTFDSNSNQLSIADPNSVGYSMVFDVRDRETSRTDTMNARTQTGFDANSNVVRTIDAKNASSTAVFDARDRRVSFTDRIGGTSSWMLDANSNVVSLTDSEGRGFNNFPRLSPSRRIHREGDKLGEVLRWRSHDTLMKSRLK